MLNFTAWKYSHRKAAVFTDKLKILEQRIEDLETNYIRLKRAYDELFLEIDNSSAVKKIQKQQGLFASELKISAKEISTKVTEKDVDGKLKNYSTISQTAEQIKSEVADVEDNMNSVINQRADSIETRVSQILDLSAAIPAPNWRTGHYKSFDTIVKNEFDELDKDTIYYTWERTTEYDDGKNAYISTGEGDQHPIEYFRYNSTGKQWEKVLDGTVYSAFYQTADGFVLKGSVVIFGNTFKQVDGNGNIFLIEGNKLSMTTTENDGDKEKFALGFSQYDTETDDGAVTVRCPYMRFGAGTEGKSSTVGGMTVYPGTGVIFKNDKALIIEFLGSDGDTNSIIFHDVGSATTDPTSSTYHSHISINGRVFIKGTSVENLQSSTSIAVFG